MFKLKYSKMFDNTVFTKYGLKPVVEDFFRVCNETFCVADGVTRDDIYGNAVSYPETEEEAKMWVKNYPNPSGAFEAAKITCDTFVSEISKLPDNQVSRDSIFSAVQMSNENVKLINQNREIDYLKEDLYCCEVVGGRIVKDILYCFSLGDCHITVLDDKFNIIFNTINNHKRFENYLENVYEKENTFDWNDPKMRIMVRKEYRNNPKQKFKGEDISFGALSGEKTSEYYVDTYSVDLKNAKYICAYSDGCEPFFESKEKIEYYLSNLDEIKNEGKERTLVVYEKE